MRTKIYNLSSIFIFVLINFMISSSVFSQTSYDRISYQAVIRDADENLVTNQTIGMQVSILVGVGTVYIETHTPTTNNNGLISIEIGGGTLVLGVWADIEWAVADCSIETEIDLSGGTNYTITGTSQLLSVPYAINAQNAIQYTAGYEMNITDGQLNAYSYHSIGLDTTLGGYIFYVTPDGKHGLVAETQDQYGAMYFSASNIISNPASHSSHGKNFTDWRLPTEFELDLLYAQRNDIGGFISDSYWSSIMYGYYDNYLYAKALDFTSNTWLNQEVTLIYSVRSVRSF